MIGRAPATNVLGFSICGCVLSIQNLSLVLAPGTKWYEPRIECARWHRHCPAAGDGEPAQFLPRFSQAVDAGDSLVAGHE